jgi:hypothetical protein
MPKHRFHLDAINGRYALYPIVYSTLFVFTKPIRRPAWFPAGLASVIQTDLSVQERLSAYTRYKQYGMTEPNAFEPAHPSLLLTGPAVCPVASIVAMAPTNTQNM